MTLEVWEAYEKRMEDWKPEFGNDSHIQVLDLMLEINRLAPKYVKMKEDRRKLKTATCQAQG